MLAKTNIMPCYTPPPTEREQNSWGILSERQLEAILCGIITKNGIEIIYHLNFNEIGVDQKTMQLWWEKHQKKDIERRKKEEEEAKRKEALAKLTTEEMKILGIAPF